MILPELVNMAAYKDNTLGNPLLCPRERLDKINRSTLEKYRDIFFNPERIVVAFAGVNHEAAVKLTEQHFGDMKRKEGPVLSGFGSETSLSDSSDEVLSTTPLLSPSSTTFTSPTSTPPPPSSHGVFSKIPFFKNLSTSASSRATVSPLNASLMQLPELDLTRPAHYTGGFLSLP